MNRFPTFNGHTFLNGRTLAMTSLVAALIFMSGCNINRDIMFRTGDFYDFAPLDEITSPGYRIAPNDLLTFQLYSNNGQRLLAMTAGRVEDKTGVNQMQNMQSKMTYLVKPDGLLELPEVGNLRLEGLTIEEAESLIEEAYSSIYVKPYSILRITNNRVLVFPGESGSAGVITLSNMNTTLLEALALSGGISARGNASKVKLIRRSEGRQDVYQMDLSTIEGLEAAALVVQANDIIYVEPMPQLISEVTQNLSPIAALISSLSLLYAFILSPGM